MDWLIVGVVAIGLIAFFMLVSQRTLTGQAYGTAYNNYANCYSFTQGLPVVATYDSIDLCANATHTLAYIAVRVPQLEVNCHGSTIQGAGGALFITEGVSNPRVTLKECVVEGFDGMYSNQDPVNVYVR